MNCILSIKINFNKPLRVGIKYQSEELKKKKLLHRITTIGPQQAFQQCMIDDFGITVTTDQEYEEASQKGDTDHSGSMTQDQDQDQTYQ